MDHGEGASVSEFVRALKSRGIPLPFEVGTFIALDVCNSLALQPCHVDGSNVFINDLGEVTVRYNQPAKDPVITRETIQLLGELLVASAPGIPEPLLSIVERSSDSGRYRLEQLRDDLEAALIPLNRGAAMRALARISREAFKVSRGRPVEEDEVGDDDVNHALDNLLGVDADEAASLRDPVVQAMPSVAPAPRSVVQAKVRAVTLLDDAGRPSGLPDDTGVLRLERDERRLQEQARRVSPLWLWAGSGLVVAAAVAFWVSSGQDRSTQAVSSAAHATREQATGAESASAAAAPSPEVDTPVAPPTAQPAVAPSQPGTAVSPAREPEPRDVVLPGKLSLSTLPAGAQVLMRVGDPGEPVLIERGLAHEFVFVPAVGGPVQRVVVGADADFSASAEGLPQHLVEVGEPQSENSAQGRIEFGPTLLRAVDRGEASGELGLVRLVAPRQGHWYKFLGTTPDAELGPLPTNVPVDLLLFRRGFRPLDVAVQPDQWRKQAAGQPLSLELELALEPAI